MGTRTATEIFDGVDLDRPASTDQRAAILHLAGVIGLEQRQINLSALSARQAVFTILELRAELRDGPADHAPRPRVPTWELKPAAQRPSQRIAMWMVRGSPKPSGEQRRKNQTAKARGGVHGVGHAVASPRSSGFSGHGVR